MGAAEPGGVIENIARYLEMGFSPAMAALKGAKEITFTVLSMSASLIAVFLPILLMGGIVGRLFREFSVTLAIAIVTSLVVSLTTTPSLCAKFLKPVHEQKHGRLYRASEKVFDGILGGYRGSLGWVLDHPLLMLGVTLGTACLSVYLYVVVPKGFFPQQDTGRLTGNVRVPPDVSFAVSSEKLQEFARIIQADPAVENVGASGGFGSSIIILPR